MDATTTAASVQPTFVERLLRSLAREFQRLLDLSAPQASLRYVALGVTVAIYALRVYVIAGFYIITYALGIFLLNLLIGFLSPQEDPDAADGFALPSASGDEFKPFVRRLPEFKFWCVPRFCGPCLSMVGKSPVLILILPSSGHFLPRCRYSSMKAVVISLLCTFFPFLDVPVFWPILLVYFIMLFTLTMRRQIAHVC
jgi:hypothetical protein